MGHVQRECKFLKRGKSRERGDDKKEDKETAAVVSDGEVVTVFQDDYVNFTCQDNEWVVDSAASFHVTPHREYFASYTAGDFGQVKMGNQGVSKIVGIGDIWVETNIGCKLH